MTLLPVNFRETQFVPPVIWIDKNQGAVLAELLATWLAGHAVPGDRMQTILLRGRLFHEHVKIVRDLIKLNAMRIKLVHAAFSSSSGAANRATSRSSKFVVCRQPVPGG